MPYARYFRSPRLAVEQICWSKLSRPGRTWRFDSCKATRRRHVAGIGRSSRGCDRIPASRRRGGCAAPIAPCPSSHRLLLGCSDLSVQRRRNGRSGWTMRARENNHSRDNRKCRKHRSMLQKAHRLLRYQYTKFIYYKRDGSSRVLFLSHRTICTRKCA
jgi:hypothetical protein